MTIKAWFLSFAVVLGMAGAGEGDTKSTRFGFSPGKWIELDLSSEGISVTRVRFDTGGVEWRPWRAGTGPQCIVHVKNRGVAESDFAFAIALFDADGNLVAAKEVGHLGDLDPGETTEFKVVFSSVNYRLSEAETVHLVIENRY